MQTRQDYGTSARLDLPNSNMTSRRFNYLQIERLLTRPNRRPLPTEAVEKRDVVFGAG
jgi:hypothetical protein